ncbi:hypothetical protein ES708_34650 [subsurface metagenome]
MSQGVSHRTARNQRGLTLPWGVHYCFVAYLSAEQQEPGDTLTHTFDIIPWYYCQTKWFTFRGTVAGELSPSVGPIFKKHRAYLSMTISPSYYSPLASEGDTYADARACVNGVTSPWTIINVGQAYRSATGYHLQRLVSYFDLTPLSGCAILNATLHLKFLRGYHIYWNADYDWNLQFRANPDLILTSPTSTHNFLAALGGSIFGTQYVADCLEWQWYTFDVTYYVSPPTFTLGITSDKDEHAIPPAPSNTWEPADFGAAFFVPGSTDRVKLVIEYIPPNSANQTP